jgi:beta-glucosidase
MLTGRPMDITGIMTADAIVAAWLPGTEGGGISEVLYGNYEFSGKLGMAWPANAASEPTKNGVGTTPRYPYDYGLKSNGTQLPGGLY